MGYYYDLEMQLKFNETSQVSFKYPKRERGRKTPFYGSLAGGKLIQIDPYGVFAIAEAEETNDGCKVVKEVCAYSLEYELQDKRAVFAEGTYDLWNPADVENTVLGMALSGTRHWKVGSVSPSLIGRYRTFSQIDSKVLPFLLDTVQKSFGCVFIFDTYQRTINVVDADEDEVTVPVYLSHANLIKQDVVTEDDSQLFTKLLVQGADGVDIRDVNPTGDGSIYNLDYFIGNGDLPSGIAAKWRTWQNAIFARQPYYTSLVALRNSATARYLTEKARLTDLENALALLDNTRATFLQMQQKESIHSENYQYFQDRLDETGVEYGRLRDEIADQKSLLEAIQADYDTQVDKIGAVNEELALSASFTKDELDILDAYFKEDSFTDPTFAVFDVDVSGGSFTALGAASIQFSDVTWTDVPCDGGHSMAAIAGGSVVLTAGGSAAIRADIVNGTLDHNGPSVVCSLFLGAGTAGDGGFPSGTLTCVCTAGYDDGALLSGMDKHEHTMTSADGSVSHTVYFYKGDASISATDCSIYFTRNVTEYQRYSVAQELYDYASGCLEDIAYPTYTFEVKCGNLLFEKHFGPFKDALQLGCAVHLQLDDDTYLKPLLLEIHLSFEKPEDLSLIFSNEFKRPDKVNGLKELLDEVSTSSRTLNTSKYTFGENNNTTTWVKELLQSGYDAALAQIRAGKDNMVTIDQAGIKISSAEGVDTVYLNNGMIALVDNRTNTVKMAMGHFLNAATGTDFVGILADIIGGVLLAGQNLIVECPDPNGGVMQFKVDSSGVIINNGRMYMRTEKGAMGWDANYGFFAGTSSLFTATDTGYVHPSCVDSDGKLILDSAGMPQNVNVWIGIDGKAYFRGNVYAENGYFSGEVNATSGLFKGTVQASTYLDSAGRNMMTNGKWDSEYLNVKGLNVNNNFIIDENGYVTIRGGSISWGAVTGTDSIDRAIQDAQDTADAASRNAQEAVISADDALADLERLANGTYPGTFINKDKIVSPQIVGATITGGTITSNTEINIGTDAHIGDNLYLGDFSDGLSAKMIRFNNLSTITGEGEYLSTSSAYLTLNANSGLHINTAYLDLSGVSRIDWGSNAPVAVLG